ncbi:MAG: phage virion morphogenesis protein [Prevotella sp.]|jgi:phage virion morphogenesis protein|nr:phage virion morphogenesis protein [Prevotella sp.]
MDIQEFARQFPQKMKELTDFVEGDDIKDIMGTEAVNHFKGSFDNEGFTDETIDPWHDVERRDPDSSWYGHSGQTGKFSTARTTAKILTGETRELRESISYKKTSLGARIINSTPYAAVHQFGLQAKIYGKKVFQMIARPFMGKSIILKQNIESKIYKRIKEIISK